MRVRIFAKKGMSTAGLRRELAKHNITASNTKPDLVLALGGDGTLLKAAREAPGAHILAIGRGTLGFLTQKDVPDTALAQQIAAKRYTIQKHPTLSIIIAGKKLAAVNDILLATPALGAAAKFDLQIDGNPISKLVCDGVLASTPLGSTGYNASLQGPVVLPGASGIILNIINPHLLRAKTLITSASSTITLTPARKINVVVDGGKPHSTRKPVIIKQGSDALTLAHINTSHFERLKRLFL